VGKLRTVIVLFSVLLCAAGASGYAFAAEAGEHAAFNRIAIDSNPSFPDLAQTARGHRFVILQAWQTDLARRLKAANPQLKVLAYKNLSFVSCDAYASQKYVPQGVRCPEVEAEHPQWFLTDTAGKRLNSAGWPWLWLMDVGDPAYQQAWAASVIAEAKTDGWDGVFMDDANPTLKYHFDPAGVARYPSDAAWSAAMRSMVAATGPRLQAAGLLAIANVCCARDYAGVWKDWLGFLSGAMDEMFTKWGNDPANGYIWDWGAGGWKTQLDEIRDAEAMGKYFLGVAHSARDDARAARYGLTTLLLASEGRATFSLAQDYTNQTWFSDYDRAGRLGSPRAPYARSGSVYRRDFANGVVIVNPSQTAVRVKLGGVYEAGNGSRIRALTLESTSGAILLRVAGATPLNEPTETLPPLTQPFVPAIPTAGDVAAELPSFEVSLRGSGRRSTTSPGSRIRIWGRVTASQPAAPGLTVTVLRRTRAGWRPIARVRTQQGGEFGLDRRLRAGSGVVPLRAVIRHAGGVARSGVVTIRLRRS